MDIEDNDSFNMNLNSVNHLHGAISDAHKEGEETIDEEGNIVENPKNAPKPARHQSTTPAVLNASKINNSPSISKNNKNNGPLSNIVNNIASNLTSKFKSNNSSTSAGSPGANGSQNMPNIGTLFRTWDRLFKSIDSNVSDILQSLKDMVGGKNGNGNNINLNHPTAGKDGKSEGIFGKILEGLGPLMIALGALFATKFGDFAGAFKQALGILQKMPEALGAILKSIPSAFNSVLEGLKKGASALGDLGKNGVNATVNAAKKAINASGNAAEKFGGEGWQAVKNAANFAKEKAEPLLKGVKDFGSVALSKATDLGKTISSAVKPVGNAVGGVLNKAKNIASIPFKIASGVGKMAGGLFSHTLGMVKTGAIAVVGAEAVHHTWEGVNSLQHGKKWEGGSHIVEAIADMASLGPLEKPKNPLAVLRNAGRFVRSRIAGMVGGAIVGGGAGVETGPGAIVTGIGGAIAGLLGSQQMSMTLRNVARTGMDMDDPKIRAQNLAWIKAHPLDAAANAINWHGRGLINGGKAKDAAGIPIDGKAEGVKGLLDGIHSLLSKGGQIAHGVQSAAGNMVHTFTPHFNFQFTNPVIKTEQDAKKLVTDASKQIIRIVDDKFRQLIASNKNKEGYSNFAVASDDNLYYGGGNGTVNKMGGGFG